MYKLPVFATIGETYRFVGSQFMALVSYAIVPAAVGSVAFFFMFLSTFAGIVTHGDASGFDLGPNLTAILSRIAELFPPGASAILSFILVIANIGFVVLFAVVWHRHYLLGPTQTAFRELFIWRGRHWRYLGYVLLLGVITIVVAFPFMAAFGFVAENRAANPAEFSLFSLMTYVVVLVVLGLIGSRLFLVFSAVSIDRTGLGFTGSFKLSRRNTWRILLVFILGWIVPYVVIFGGIGLITFAVFVPNFSSNSVYFGLLLFLLQQAIYYVTFAISITMLSIIYKKLVDNLPVATAPSEPGAT